MIEYLKKQCTGCRACEKLCPQNAIEMREDERGFLYPHIDYEKCIKCGICKSRCPINHVEKKHNIEAYAAFNKDEKIRKQSSSGGVFTLFAEHVIDKKGVVFGVAFDNDFKVEHIKIEKKEDLAKLRGSKYLQSNTKNTYIEAKKVLEQGRLVYYSGTPCQIEGLYAYLGKDYENLITQDVICHGVPSPKIWESYLKYKNRKIEKINFRSKEDCTWQNFEISFEYNDYKENMHHDEDVYMKLFLKDIILRESCYNCSFKKENRIADITLADFWGIDNVASHLNDQKGTSLLIVHSNKAEALKNAVLNKMIIEKVDFYEAIKHNPSMIKSVVKHEKSEEIFDMLKNGKIFEVFKQMAN